MIALSEILLITALLSIHPEGGDYEPGGDQVLSYRQQIMTARRNAEATRRTLARMRLPAPTFTDEQRAACWMRMARSFDSYGRLAEAAMVQQRLMQLYPSTDAAKTAQMWLWDHGY